MSELQIIIKQAVRDVIHEELKPLFAIISKDKIDTTWVTEKDAADMFQLAPRTLRKYVKKAKKTNDFNSPFADIEYRDTNGRRLQYNRKDLLKAKNRYTHV